MSKITFIKDWNGKLQCGVFTSFRKWTATKEEYYRKKINNFFDVEVAGIVRFQARLCSVDVKKLEDFDKYLLIIDTGEDNPYLVFKKFGIEESDKAIMLLFDGRGKLL